MKSYLLIALSALFLSVAANAEPQQALLKVMDNNPYGQLCLAAADSDDALQAKLDELGIAKRVLNRIECNGLAIADFARKYDIQKMEWSIVKVH